MICDCDKMATFSNFLLHIFLLRFSNFSNSANHVWLVLISDDIFVAMKSYVQMHFFQSFEPRSNKGIRVFITAFNACIYTIPFC